MILKSSPKIYNNYKCNFPENTIDIIGNGFKKIGLSLNYKQQEIKTEKYSSYSGVLLEENMGFSTFGKGLSPILSKASAYAEMAERFSTGFFTLHHYDDLKNIDRYNELLKDVVERKFLRGWKKNRNSDLTNFTNISRYFQNKISKDEYSMWKNQGLFDTLVDSYSLVKKNYLKLPIKFLDIVSGSTGLASGNTLEEAITQGTCEIFERSAASKIVFEKIECPTIEITTIRDDRIQKFVEMFNSMNFDVIIKDFTLNNTLPVVAVLFINHNIEDDDNQFKIDRYYKMIDVGSHINLNEAVLRCFVERLQELTKEEFMHRKKADTLYNFWTKELSKQYKKNEEATLDIFANYDYAGDLSFLEEGKMIPFNELVSVNSSDNLDDCKTLTDICKRNNWDLQIIDFTHKILKFPTVRVVIPRLSTDYEPLMRKLLRIKNHEEKFNFFYRIKDFYKYIADDNWINNKEKISTLINNIEESLSMDLYAFHFCLMRGNFQQFVNLFNILAFSNMAIEKYENAKKYFKIMLELKYIPAFFSTYFNKLLNPGYNPSLHSDYIKNIDTGLENNNMPRFNYKCNPFKPELYLEGLEQKFVNLLKNINKSFLN